MRSPDWTVAWDDLFTLRWRACIFCRAAAQRLELRALATGHARTMAVCGPCLKHPEVEQRLLALVQEEDARQPRQVERN